MIGKRFGRLVCVEQVASHVSSTTKKKNNKYKCVCDCGNTKEVIGTSLRAGRTQSCGCIRKDITKHGFGRRANRGGTYSSWAQMLSRCRNSKVPGYKHYGGRGITVCERWNSFMLFLEDMGERPSGCSIDRIDVNSGYSPENCRWATRQEQALNTRRSRILHVSGVSMTAKEWANITGVKYPTLITRLHRGWPPEKAITP